MAEKPRYRLDFIVPEGHDITETETERHRTLETLRAALDADRAWERSMLAPWRPFRDEAQHLIVWVDLKAPVTKEILGERVAAIVGDALPGARLEGVQRLPPY